MEKKLYLCTVNQTNKQIRSKVIKKIIKIEEMEKEMPLMTQVRELMPGESVSAPLEKASWIRATVSQYGKMAQKIFRCNANSEERVIVITRIN
jgi:hypothetical protein